MNETSDYSTSNSPFDLKDVTLDCQAIFEKENSVSSLESNSDDKELLIGENILNFTLCFLFISSLIFLYLFDTLKTHFPTLSAIAGVVSILIVMFSFILLGSQDIVINKMTLLFFKLPFYKNKKSKIKEQIDSIHQEILDKKNNLKQFFTPDLKRQLDKFLVDNQPDLKQECCISYVQEYNQLNLAFATEDYPVIFNSIEHLFDIIKMTTQQTFSADINLIEKIKTLL